MATYTPTYLELGDGRFVNAEMVTVIGLHGFGETARVAVDVPGSTMFFHGDRVCGEQAAKAVILALLAELGRPPTDVGKLRVITYLDGSVQARFL